MELKSPVTVRPTGSVVPFERQQPYVAYQQPEQVLVRGVQPPVYNTNSLNRNMSSSSSNYPYRRQQQPQTNSATIGPTRNVFLNRAYSETPRAPYTNGYETDTGVGYHHPHHQVYPASYTTIGHTNSMRVPVPVPVAPSRYQAEQSGYDTDTGLIKLRHVLDSTKQQRAPSRNNNNTSTGGYYYAPAANRSVTPSFAYISQQQQQPAPTPILRTENTFCSSPYNLVHQQQQQQQQHYNNENSPTSYLIDSNNGQQQQYLESDQYNGLVEASLPGYLTPNGGQYIYNEGTNRIVLADESNNGRAVITSARSPSQPQSFIISQQIAPSATYSKSATSQSALHSSSVSTLPKAANNIDMTIRGLGTASASNLSSTATTTTTNNQSQTKEDIIRSSSNSLTGNFNYLKKNYFKYF